MAGFMLTKRRADVPLDDSPVSTHSPRGRLSCAPATHGLLRAP